MCEIIMVGCDLHAQTMLLKMAVGLGPARERCRFATRSQVGRNCSPCCGPERPGADA